MEKLSMYALKVGSIVDKVKSGLLNQNFVIMGEIHSTIIMRAAGYEVPYIHQIFFFRPEIFNMLLNLDFDSIVHAPLQVLITQDPETELIEVRYATFKESFYTYTALDPVFKQADESLKRAFSFRSFEDEKSSGLFG